MPLRSRQEHYNSPGIALGVEESLDSGDWCGSDESVVAEGGLGASIEGEEC